MKKAIFIGLCFWFCSYTLFAQNIRIKLGPDKIAANQAFTITVEVQNERLSGYGDFPDIEGFIKRGISSSSSTNIINGQISSTNSVTQSYAAQGEGTYVLKPFSITVNGKVVGSAGKKIVVGPPAQQRTQRNWWDYDPFEDFYGTRKQEFVDVEDDAFLALSVNKDEVYVGEGFTATLAFYVSESNRAPLTFYETGTQLLEIIKKIKPANCWEENFNIENIERVNVMINNKNYAQYKLYQASFFPLNSKPIEFPSVPLKMIKYKVAKNQTFFGRNRKEDFKTYFTKPKTVLVKELPEHPMKEKVAVGRFKLDEKISSQSLQTGNSFEYFFTVMGEGNISAIDNPSITETRNFDFYPPNINQRIKRSNNKVKGSKTYSYYAIPNEPGRFNLGKFFKWVYFDPVEEKYDTLQSKIFIEVTGESKKNITISSSDLGSFYDIIDIEDNSIIRRQQTDWINYILASVAVVIAATTLYIAFKK